MKKISIVIFVLFISISLIGCSRNKEDYVKSNPKTFSNDNFTITATIDYVQSDKYGDEVFVLEGLNGESIVAYYDYANPTMEVEETTLEKFTQNVIELSEFDIDEENIKEIVINKEVGYVNVKAKYFSVKQGKGSFNDTDEPQREDFYIHYTKLFDENSYKWIVVTAKVDNAFAVVYIGGRESMFDKKYNEYLLYAESLLIKDVEERDTSFEQLLSSTLLDTGEESFSDITGFKMKLPSDFVSYPPSGIYYANASIPSIEKNNLIYGSIDIVGNASYSLPAYGWTRQWSYSIIQIDDILDEYVRNKHMVFIGKDKYLGVYETSGKIIEDYGNHLGSVSENLSFKFKVNNTLYALEFTVSADFCYNTSSSLYNKFKWHSSDSVEIDQYLANMKENVFNWIQTIELV